MPDPTITLAIKVNGTDRATQNIPVRKVKVLLQDILPDGGTVAEKAQAVLDWVVARAKDALSTDAPRLGDRQYDVMLAKVREADDTWDHAKVVAKGMEALEAAYDALT